MDALRRRPAAHRDRRADAHAALRPRGQRLRHRLRRAVPQHGAALRGPGGDHPRRRPAAQRAGHVRARRRVRGLGRGGRAALRADAERPRRSSATTRGATRPAAADPATARRARRGECPACASGCCSAPTSHGGFYFSTRAAAPHRARARSCSPTARCRSSTSSTTSSSTTAAGGCRSGTFRLTDAEGTSAGVLVHRPRLGVLPGRRLLRRLRRRARPGRLPRRRPRRGRGVGRHAIRRRSSTRPATRSSSTTTGRRASCACAAATRTASPTSSAWSSGTKRTGKQ